MNELQEIKRRRNFYLSVFNVGDLDKNGLELSNKLFSSIDVDFVDVWKETMGEIIIDETLEEIENQGRKYGEPLKQ